MAGAKLKKEGGLPGTRVTPFSWEPTDTNEVREFVLEVVPHSSDAARPYKQRRRA